MQERVLPQVVPPHSHQTGQDRTVQLYSALYTKIVSRFVTESETQRLNPEEVRSAQGKFPGKRKGNGEKVRAKDSFRGEGAECKSGQQRDPSY